MKNKIIDIQNMPELPYSVEEAVNRLRINISFLGSKIKKIMVVSTFPNEGKSFVAIQLWKQMAATGTDSLLLDADLRKSVAVEKYGMVLAGNKKITGTSHVLSENCPISDAVYHTKWEHGDILPNVDNVVNPSVLLEGERFRELLDTASENYRYVFVDSPPLELVSDGEKIGSLCDGAILIVRAGSTPKATVKNSIRQLERAGCPLLGIVLNRVEGSKGGYYSKKYGGKGYYYRKYGYGAAYYGNSETTKKA